MSSSLKGKTGFLVSEVIVFMNGVQIYSGFTYPLRTGEQKEPDRKPIINSHSTDHKAIVAQK